MSDKFVREWQPKMAPAELTEFLAREFPQALEFPVRVTHLEEGALVLRLAVDARALRPGGTVSGPTLMTLADTAMYFLILTHLGPMALAVTTSLHIDFLRRPEPRDVLARAELLKLGRGLVVGRVVLTSESDPRPVAHASVSYALPPAASAKTSEPAAEAKDEATVDRGQGRGEGG